MHILDQALVKPPIQRIIPESVSRTLEESRKPLPEGVITEVTSDMQYLQQYFFIREYAYRNDLQVKTFSGDEDEIDRRSHLIVSRKGHFCIGGTRVTISTPDAPALLPVERGSFRIKDYVPFLKSDDVYGEFGRTAVLPQYRDSEALTELFKTSIEVAKASGCKYIFGASPPAVARLFQRTFRQLGYRDELRRDIPAPMGEENQHLKLVFKILYLED